MNTWPPIATVDPANYYTDVLKVGAFLDMVGTLLNWACAPEFQDNPALDAFEQQYAFGCMEIPGDYSISSDGVLRYPGDPPQYPLLSLHRRDETIYFYQYSVVGIVSADGSTYLTRMD